MMKSLLKHRIIPYTFPRLKGVTTLYLKMKSCFKLPVHVNPFLDHKGYDCETDKQVYGCALKDFSSRFGQGSFDSN